MNWKKPSMENVPPFKKIMLGLQLPNKIALVQLDRIDETGLVFTKVENSFTGLFSGMLNASISVNIDYFSEIDLSSIEESTNDTETKTKTETGQTKR